MRKLSRYFSFNIDRSLLFAHMERLATSEASNLGFDAIWADDTEGRIGTFLLWLAPSRFTKLQPACESFCMFFTPYPLYPQTSIL